MYSIYKGLLFFAVFTAVFGVQVVLANSIERDITNAFKDYSSPYHGGNCYKDDDCSVISYCKPGQDFLIIGECRLVWWFILIIVVIALFILSSIVSCLCCPCCLLYSCGKAICECLCCCCPSSSRGYRPARH